MRRDPRNPGSKGSRSTYARRSKARAVCVVALAAIIVAVPATSPIGTATALGVPGIIGFITNDGLFFVQVGYSQFGYVTYYVNGSDLYTAALIVNLTAITLYNATAHIAVFTAPGNAVVATLNVGVVGYTTQTVAVNLPAPYGTYAEFKLTVDGTPFWFYDAMPYAFLGLTALENGGPDLATFIAVGLFFAYALPLMVKSERMTKRAIYAPKWNATLWLHGIFFGMVAWYFVSFPSINMTFKGWEFVVIPIPEAMFLFFWNAGRHSKNTKVRFTQVVARLGRPLELVEREYFSGQDADGDLVIMRSRSPFQWWYRSRGHHVKVWRHNEEGAPTPFPLNVISQQQLTEEQVHDPARFPHTAKYDARDDLKVVNIAEDDDAPVVRQYYVPRLSAFKVTWPHLVWHRDVVVPEHPNLITGGLVPETTKPKLCWPYVEDGRADVTLCSYHYMTVIAQREGYMTAEDAANALDRIEVQLWTERGFRHTETSRKADERLLAEEDIRDRPGTDLAADQLEAYVTPLPNRRDRRALGSGEQQA